MLCGGDILLSDASNASALLEQLESDWQALHLEASEALDAAVRVGLRCDPPRVHSLVWQRADEPPSSAVLMASVERIGVCCEAVTQPCTTY